MREHQDEFIPFLTNAQGNMMDQSEFESSQPWSMLLANDCLAEFDDYCEKLATTAEWGGHAEVDAGFTHNPHRRLNSLV